MVTWYVAPGAPVTNSGTSWLNAGDLQTIVNNVINTPTRGGDEIWCRYGTYSFATPLVINNNSEPLSIYGAFAGTEQFLCQRNANIVTPPTAVTPNYFQFPSILDGGNVNRVKGAPNN